MEREHPGPDTGKIEMERIIDCLRVNGYEFEGLEGSKMYGFMTAKFNKDVKYSDIDGNYINDSSIKMQIIFDSKFDYKNKYRSDNEDEDFTFGRKEQRQGNRFIENLMSTNYDVAAGHKKRNANNKKTRKNRK
jgi:hypothetical protein